MICKQKKTAFSSRLGKEVFCVNEEVQVSFMVFALMVSDFVVDCSLFFQL